MQLGTCTGHSRVWAVCKVFGGAHGDPAPPHQLQTQHTGIINLIMTIIFRNTNELLYYFTARSLELTFNAITYLKHNKMF